MAMRRRLAAAALVVAAVAPAGAWSRIETQEDIGPATVRARLDGAVATFTAKYAIDVDDYVRGRATLPLPDKGLVTAATATLRGVAHPLALLPADEASARFDALGADERGEGERTSAVLITGSAGTVTLGVAAPHEGVIALELTVAAPTCFYRDARYVHVPAAWKKVIELARRGPVPDEVPDVCTPDGTERDAAGWIGLPAPELTKRPSGERIGAFAGRAPLDQEHIARVELDLSGALADVPRDLATVIVVDGSRSMSADEIEAQRQIVASYLAAAPASRVQVVAYARRARALLPSWTTAAPTAGRVDRELRALAPRNGSAFDAGLVEAARWLDRIGGTKRIVLVTDERMAEKLSETPPATFKRLLPDGVLVHVVAVDATPQQPTRDEDAVLAPLAAATDGMAVRAGALPKSELLDATVLVRPLSLDFITVDAPGWTQITPGDLTACGSELDNRLEEGHGCTWWGEGDASSGPITISGLLWGRRVKRLVTPELQHARDVARELTALGTLDSPLLERAQELAHAVDERWSLYAQWGGDAKYTNGYGYGIGGGATTGGVTDEVGVPHGVLLSREWPDPELAKQLRPLIAKCGAGGIRITAQLEFTLAEIVGVEVTLHPADPVPASVLRRRTECVEDAIWDATPMLTHIEAHRSYSVEL